MVEPFLTAQKWDKAVYFEDGLARLLKVMNIPTTILIDKSGRARQPHGRLRSVHVPRSDDRAHSVRSLKRRFSNTCEMSFAASSGSFSTASASARCRTPLSTATRAATRWATSPRAASCISTNLCRLGLGNIRPLDRPPAGSGADRRLREMCAGVARQGHDHGPLGNGGHSSGETVSRFTRTDFRPRSWTNSSAASGAPRSATRPRRGPRSSKSWARSTCAPARRSSTRRRIASSRSPRTKK